MRTEILLLVAMINGYFGLSKCRAAAYSRMRNSDLF